MADGAQEIEESPLNNDASHVPDLEQLCQEVDQLSVVDEPRPRQIPEYVNQFLDKLESKLEKYEPVDASNKFGQAGSDDEVFLFISAIQRLAKLVNWSRRNEDMASAVLNRASSLQHRAMVVLEEQAILILDQWKGPSAADPNPQHNNNYINININMRKRLASFRSSSSCNQRDQQQQQQQQDDESPTSFLANYSAQDMSIMSLISRSMILAGYGTECGDVFRTTRRGALEEELRCQGMAEKMSVEDVQRIQWDSLEGEIATWIRILKRCSNHILPCELRFYQALFEDTPDAAWKGAYSSHAGSLIQQLLSFAHAVAITPKSTEKLFKFLDMYEALRELGAWVDDVSNSRLTQGVAEALNLEIATATAHLADAAVLIFFDLETSIRSDNTKQQPIPSGAVHPLIRYTMNYLKYACEYKDTLEDVFRRCEGPTASTPFAAIVQLLASNVDAKSKLYKDPSLRYVFLMNNGRYMLQKIRGSAELRQAVGDAWYRNKSSEMRSYHKSYQRDTWGKILKCLSPEGLLVNAKLQKPVLKERFKSFNQLFDEIHKTQSAWVVSDEQLKSELRVSISAVMIPAYRAFLARYANVFTPGRQYEKHVKYQPDDIEAAIEELFEGNPTSLSRRRT